MAEPDHRAETSNDKAKQREARAMVEAYHQEQLRALLEHVREAFNQLDAGDIDEFELDNLIHRYKRAAKHLWIFCESSSGQSEARCCRLDVHARPRRGTRLVGPERPSRR